MQNHWQLPEMVGTGPELQPLADKVSGAWLAFARTRQSEPPGHSEVAGVHRDRSIDDAHRQRVDASSNDPDRDERLALGPLPRLPMF